MSTWKISHIKQGIESKSITTWEQVLELYRKTPLAQDMGIRVESLERKVKNPGRFTTHDLLAFASILECEPDLVWKFNLELVKKMNAAKSKSTTKKQS